MVATARKFGIATTAKKTTEGIGRCIDHAFELLGFTSGWALAHFIEDLARRSPGKKRNVRLPRWKVPDGLRAVVAVRCKHCKGRGCIKCDHYGWGILLKVPIHKRPCPRHEAATP
jgi:hypothetical protein